MIFLLLFVGKTPEFSTDHSYSWSILHSEYQNLTGNPLPTLHYTTTGKPYLKETPYQFNISHSHGYIALALGVAELGVDIQIHKPPKESLLQRVCSPEEQQWFHTRPPSQNAEDFSYLWVAKEAYVKFLATGVGSGRELPQHSFPPQSSSKIEHLSFDSYHLSRWCFPPFSLALVASKPTENCNIIPLSKDLEYILSQDFKP